MTRFYPRRFDANERARAEQCPSIALIPLIDATRREGESIVEAAMRLVIYEALATTKTQREAAKKLGITYRMMTYYVRICKFTKFEPVGEPDKERSQKDEVANEVLGPQEDRTG